MGWLSEGPPFQNREDLDICWKEGKTSNHL